MCLYVCRRKKTDQIGPRFGEHNRDIRENFRATFRGVYRLVFRKASREAFQGKCRQMDQLKRIEVRTGLDGGFKDVAITNCDVA
jgi:hypothetical protein